MTGATITLFANPGLIWLVTTHQHPLLSSGGGAVDHAVRACDPLGPTWDDINAYRAGSRSESGKRMRPSRPRRLVVTLAAALQGCAQVTQEAGATRTRPPAAVPQSFASSAAFRSGASNNRLVCGGTTSGSSNSGANHGCRDGKTKPAPEPCLKSVPNSCSQLQQQEKE